MSVEKEKERDAMSRYTKRNLRKRNRKIRPLSLWWMLPILILAGAIPELLLHFLTAKGPTDVWNGGVPLSFLFSVVNGGFLFGICLAIPRQKLRYWISFAGALLPFLFCGAQLVYYSLFDTFFSAFSMANGGQVLEFWKIALQAIGKNFFWILLQATPLISLCVLKKRFYAAPAGSQWQRGLLSVAASVMLQLLLIWNLSWFGGTAVTTPYDLYHNNMDSYLSVNRLGLNTAMRLDITHLLGGKQVQGSISLGNPTPTMPPIPTQPAETQPTQPGTEPEKPTVDTSPNVLDIDFDALIAGESNDAIREVHQFFQSRQPSNKNEKTGMFEGCNLIMITAEAFSPVFVTEERTPTLYKLMHEGFNFTNYYVPTWGASTTDGEYCFLTGTIPKPNVWSFRESADNAMPLTMSMQLKERGYNAFAYHGHTYTYYKRNEYLTNLGFYYRGYGGSSDGKKVNGLPIQYTWPESDLEVVDVTTGDFVGKSPFVAYYMSISGHRNFAFDGNQISRKNLEYVKNEPYSEEVKAYIACQLELEFSLTLLMERLEEAGQLENTVIVLTADHYPYGLTDAQYSELLGHPVETNFERHKNACIIYKPGMTPETIDKPASHFDILPTLSNLFGLEFDSRLYMGRDVFSEAAGLVVFPNYSWITDYASYNAGTGKVENRTSYEVTEEYVEGVQRDMTNRFAVSMRILDYDYWAILFE
ncbi:MAG: LTA synthase family protein [Ruminococcaceae bacterium]|nr:LTA synthase family protein [Oscillospiraceae bacterium]